MKCIIFRTLIGSYRSLNFGRISVLVKLLASHSFTMQCPFFLDWHSSCHHIANCSLAKQPLINSWFDSYAFLDLETLPAMYPMIASLRITSSFLWESPPRDFPSHTCLSITFLKNDLLSSTIFPCLICDSSYHTVLVEVYVISHFYTTFIFFLTLCIWHPANHTTYILWFLVP